MAVEASKVMALREKTGLPMMECKKALEKTGGDEERAYEELRKGGLKAQQKLAGRAAKEGRVSHLVSKDGRMGVLVALRCETEPVAKNEHFQSFLAELVEIVARDNPKDVEALKGLKTKAGHTVEEGLTELVNRIRENISLGRFARLEGDAIGQYVHFDGKKAAMVSLKGGSPSDPKVVEAGKDLSMHVVFANSTEDTRPQSLSREGLDAQVVAKEREILLDTAKRDPKNANKPEQILKKIIEGQVDKFMAAKCLLEQPFIRDDKQTVAQYLKGCGLTVTGFAYIAADQA